MENYYVVLQEQDINEQELEIKLKKISSKYLRSLYKNGDFSKSIQDEGFYVFGVFDDQDYLEEALEEFKQEEIIVSVHDEKEFKSIYFRYTIVINAKQEAPIDVIEYYLKLICKNLLFKEYNYGEFKNNINIKNYYLLCEETDLKIVERICYDLEEIYKVNYTICNSLIFSKKFKEEIHLENKYLNQNYDDNKLNINFSKIEEFDNFFKSKIIGQKSVLQKIKTQLINLSYSLELNSGKDSRPAGIFFFVGPTGVGKTEICKELNVFLYNNNNINRFDMSEYKSGEVSIDKLIGAPNGLVGYEEGGTLINAMIKNPNSIILFDEIEKASTKILDIFLQILDEGFVTSNKGEKIFFKNNIIIFTSNLGTSKITSQMDSLTIEKIIKDEIDNFFTNEIHRPEILGRIGRDNIVVFNTITQKKDLYRILDIHFNKFIQEFQNKKINLIFDKVEVYESILSRIDITKGARDIRNNFETFKSNFLQSLFDKQIYISNLNNQIIHFTYTNNKIKIIN